MAKALMDGSRGDGWYEVPDWVVLTDGGCIDWMANDKLPVPNPWFWGDTSLMTDDMREDFYKTCERCYFI